jgi:mono/diheme cytochrome c family protein
MLKRSNRASSGKIPSTAAANAACSGIPMNKLIATLPSILLLGTLPALAADKVDFAKDILPIFEKRCVQCHGPEKQKGKLRMDTKEAAMKGGKDGPILTAGNAEKSELFRRISLPKGDDDVMPNEGEPLTKEQIALIKDWINQGAVWPDTAIVKATGAPTATAAPAPVLPPEIKPSANEQKALAKLSQQGIEVRPLAMNTNWKEANLRQQGTNVTDATLAALKDVASLIELNLAGTKVTDAGLDHLKNLTNLMRLHLELTKVSDAGVTHLKKLPNLTYLNLYGTQITDAGLEQLKGLKNLRQVYVWQTKVTTNGVASLKKSLPNVDVNTGWDLTALAKKEEKKPDAEKKDEKKEEKKEEKK